MTIRAPSVWSINILLYFLTSPGPEFIPIFHHGKLSEQDHPVPCGPLNSVKKLIFAKNESFLTMHYSLHSENCGLIIMIA